MSIASVVRRDLDGILGIGSNESLFDKIDEVITEVNAQSLEFHSAVADLAGLKAIALAELVDRMVVLCEALGTYRYDSAATDTADDVNVVTPTAAPAGVGRFIRITMLETVRWVGPPVADLAALKAVAVTGLYDNGLYFCDALGLYAWDAASTATADDYQVVTPTAAPAGVGRFVLQMERSKALKVATPVADLAAAKALPVAALATNSLLWIATLGLYWLNPTSAATADDVNVIQLTAEIGNARLVRVTQAAEYRPVHAPVADLAALKAIVEADRIDNMTVLVDTLGIYQCDLASAATADDVNVVTPTDTVGRWLLLTPIVANRAWHAPVADLAALKAITEADRADNMLILVEALGVYRCAAAGAATADDDAVVTPTDTVGRWMLQTRVDCVGQLRVVDLPVTDISGVGAVALTALHATKSCTVFDAKVVVRTAPTGGTATVQVGTVAGAANGWLNDISTAVPGVISAGNTWTIGGAITYLAATTWGAELADFLLGADAVTTGGHFDRVSLEVAAGDPIEYTFPDPQTSTDISIRVFYCVNPV